MIDDNSLSPQPGEGFSDHSPVPVEKHKASKGRSHWSDQQWTNKLGIQLLDRKMGAFPLLLILDAKQGLVDPCY